MYEMKNIMSIDLEDYFCDLPFSIWPEFESRVIKNTQKILDLFEKYNVRATFFTLGYIAEKYPGLIEKIKSSGHEIASHGYSHTDLRKMTKESFESDLSKSLSILERISGEKVLGFRAPFFSVSTKNFWVFDILKKFLRYDSSIFPVKTSRYGISGAMTNPYFISEENPLKEDVNGNFLEIPPTVLKLSIFGKLPVAGGFYLRFLPFFFLKWGIKQMNKSGFPAMCFLHPRDLDTDMPSIKEYSWDYYWGIKSAFKKFESLLKNFKFSSVQEVMKI